MISCKGPLKIYNIYQEYESKRKTHKRESIDLYVFQKPLYFMLLLWIYSKICNSTPNPSWTIFASHFSILQAVPKMHCLYASAIVQPACNTTHVTWQST